MRNSPVYQLINWSSQRMKWKTLMLLRSISITVFAHSTGEAKLISNAIVRKSILALQSKDFKPFSHKLSGDQATWSTRNALETSTLVFDIRSKHGSCRCTSAISCQREGGQGNVPQDKCWEEGRDRTACSRARGASDGSVLRYEASGTSQRKHSWNYFKEFFKNSYSWNFWPAKYKRYTVSQEALKRCRRRCDQLQAW